MLGYEWLQPYTIYVGLSAVVAILIWLECEILKKTDGKLPKSNLFYLSSTLDTMWFFISVIVLYMIEIPPIALSVPAAYGVYSIGGWIYGSRLLRKTGIPESTKDLVIPKAYLAYSQSFALIYFLLCLFVLAAPWILPSSMVEVTTITAS